MSVMTKSDDKTLFTASVSPTTSAKNVTISTSGKYCDRDLQLTVNAVTGTITGTNTVTAPVTMNRANVQGTYVDADYDESNTNNTSGAAIKAQCSSTGSAAVTAKLSDGSTLATNTITGSATGYETFYISGITINSGKQLNITTGTTGTWLWTVDSSGNVIIK